MASYFGFVRVTQIGWDVARRRSSLCVCLSVLSLSGDLALPELISHEPPVIARLQSPHTAAMMTGGVAASRASERIFNALIFYDTSGSARASQDTSIYLDHLSPHCVRKGSKTPVIISAI